MSFTEIEQHQAAAWAPTVIVLGEANRIVNTRGK
jgi:aspartate 1-decarboxylase